MPLIALTRAVPDSITRCELTHLERTAIDLDRARMQHAAYEHALEALGCRVQHVSSAMDLPDSVFVEDAAVVLDELAVITRPGAASRQPETPAIAEALAEFRPVTSLSEPATLDGGDVLRIGRRIFIGVGARTNASGVRQLQEAVAPHGYDVVSVSVGECLHLKSGVTAVSDEAVILNPRWVDSSVFRSYERIEVEPDEPFAANVLRIGETLVCAAGAPKTNARLARRRLAIVTVDVSELAKAEAGVTCCSLILG
jgi:dimethylargininase